MSNSSLVNNTVTAFQAVLMCARCNIVSSICRVQWSEWADMKQVLLLDPCFVQWSSWCCTC